MRAVRQAAAPFLQGWTSPRPGARRKPQAKETDT